MEQRVVTMLLVGLMMVVLTELREVRCDPVLYEQAEPSHHVMHIRKLTDSDRLKIELEPVWFHLESAEQQAAGGSQQVKRQAKQHPSRPVQVFSNLKHLERYRRKNRYDSEPDAEPAQQRHSSEAESYLKDFWHADVPSDQDARSHETAPKASDSLEQQLEDIELPSCFRQYLHEMYDRNNESVRKLMRCLGQQSRLEERRPGRLPAYRDRYDRETDDPHQALYGRKAVIRRRKFTDQHERAPAALVDAGKADGLKFEQHYIRSDSDDGGHVFTPAADDSDSESSDSSSSDEGAEGNYVRSQADESPEEPPERRQLPRYGEPYRRPPPKYNTQQRRRDSMESDEDCSCAGSESCESC